jgi:hypothetical protein
VADPGPLDEPAGERSSFQGFRGCGFRLLLLPPLANSDIASLPCRTRAGVA